MSSVKKILPIVVILIAIQVAFSILWAVFVITPAESNVIHNGVFIDNVDVGGLTQQEAKFKLAGAVEPNLDNSKISIKFNNQEWNLSYVELGVKPNYDRAVNNAFEVGREKYSIVRALNIFKLKRQKMNLPLTFEFDEEKSKKAVNKIVEEVERKPQNAKVAFQDNELKLIPERMGYKGIFTESLVALKKAINQRNTTSSLVVKEIIPQVTAKDLKVLDTDLAVAVTTFDKDNKNRRNNINLSAKYLNSSLIKPGDSFSFNKAVGLRYFERGYKKAAVIKNSKITEGVGGGTCQVSTTLYQAVLLAGLEVVERHPHSLPVDYVPLGQDAAVADGQLDLIVKNNKDYPVLIISYVKDDELIVRITGREENEKKVSLESEIVKTIEPEIIVKKDSNLFQGVTKVLDPGQKGYKVKVYRVITSTTGKTEKLAVSTSYYKPQDKIIKIGTKINPNIRTKK